MCYALIVQIISTQTWLYFFLNNTSGYPIKSTLSYVSFESCLQIWDCREKIIYNKLLTNKLYVVTYMLLCNVLIFFIMYIFY